MKLRYLGTAAAEGIPALFCNCRVCQNALEKRGREVKTRSQALLDDTILIDFPADTYMHMLHLGLKLREIPYCIVTHSHSDHFQPEEFWCRLEGIAHGLGEEPMHIYLTESGYWEALECHGKNADGKRLKFHKIEAFSPFMIEDYRITPLKANHDATASPVIFVIEHAAKAMLYANDTGILPEESWDYLSKMKVKFDFISLDCTFMLKTGARDGHMGLDSNREFHQRLIALGFCDESTMVYVNHFSHNGLATHEELVEAAGKLGYGVSYDGLEVSF